MYENEKHSNAIHGLVSSLTACLPLVVLQQVAVAPHANVPAAPRQRRVIDSHVIKF